MNKNIINTALLTAVLLASAQFAQASPANGMPYEPVFEALPINESITTVKANPTPIAQNTTPAISKIGTTSSTVVPAVDKTGGIESDNLQNALMQLDSAQVEIRNTLIQYKTEYTDIDNQYKNVKEQRKLKSKQVKETEKKIKNIDNTKEKIRKSM